jgi:hypothetical protein
LLVKSTVAAQTTANNGDLVHVLGERGGWRRIVTVRHGNGVTISAALASEEDGAEELGSAVRPRARAQDRFVLGKEAVDWGRWSSRPTCRR